MSSRNPRQFVQQQSISRPLEVVVAHDRHSALPSWAASSTGPARWPMRTLGTSAARRRRAREDRLVRRQGQGSGQEGHSEHQDSAVG